MSKKITKESLYIITNISMPGICKVGVTKSIEQRLKDLNKTGNPTKFQLYEKFELENVGILEQKILQHFAKQRISRKREFLQIHPEKICDFIADNKNIKLEKDEEISGKFAKLGIKEGEKLKFKVGDEIYQNIIAEAKGGNIIYKNKITSLSNSAQKILAEKFEKNGKQFKEQFSGHTKGKQSAN